MIQKNHGAYIKTIEIYDFSEMELPDKNLQKNSDVFSYGNPLKYINGSRAVPVSTIV